MQQEFICKLVIPVNPVQLERGLHETLSSGPAGSCAHEAQRGDGPEQAGPRGTQSQEGRWEQWMGGGSCQPWSLFWLQLLWGFSKLWIHSNTEAPDGRFGWQSFLTSKSHNVPGYSRRWRRSDQHLPDLYPSHQEGSCSCCLGPCANSP